MTNRRHVIESENGFRDTMCVSTRYQAARGGAARSPVASDRHAGGRR